MPRLKKAVPKYRKHRASGQAVVSIEGRDFYLGLYRSKASRVEYDSIIGEWLAAGRQLPKHYSVNEITTSEVLARYWAFARDYYRKDGKPTPTLDGIKQALKPLRKLYGPKPAPLCQHN